MKLSNRTADVKNLLNVVYGRGGIPPKICMDVNELRRLMMFQLREMPWDNLSERIIKSKQLRAWVELMDLNISDWQIPILHAAIASPIKQKTFVVGVRNGKAKFMEAWKRRVNQWVDIRDAYPPSIEYPNPLKIYRH